MVIAIWILTAFVLGLWSMAAWGLHALLGFDAGRLAAIEPLLDRVPYAELLSRWWPGWQDIARFTIDIAQTVLGAVGGIAPVVVAVVWGVGTLLIVLGGGLLALVAALIRKAVRPAQPA